MMTEATKKSWFQKPENITTLLSFIALGAIGIMFLDKVLPIVNRVLEYALEATWKAVLLGTMLVVITWVLTSKDLHKVAWFFYKSAMRWLTELVITIDPIAILKSYVKTLHDNLANIRKSLGDLRGQAHSLRSLIAETAKKLKASQGYAVEAHKRAGAGQKGMRSEFMLQARKAGRLQESGVTYQGLLNRVEAHIAVMEKIEEAAKLMVLDIEDTVEVKTKEREMIHSSFKAMSAAKKILAQGEQREMYDMAMEVITKDYHLKLGEIEQFMEDSQHFVNTMDLQNGVYEAEALAKLEEWDQRSIKLLEGGTGNTKFRLEAAPHHDFQAEDQEIVKKIERSSYADLFDKI